MALIFFVQAKDVPFDITTDSIGISSSSLTRCFMANKTDPRPTL